MRWAASLGRGEGGLGVTDLGEGLDFSWDLTRFTSTNDLLTQVAEKLDVSQDTARMLVEGFAA